MILEFIAIGLIILWSLPIIYQEKLVRYLQEYKPEIYNSLTPNPIVPSFILLLLPFKFPHTNTIKLVRYLFKNTEQDDIISKRYKKIIVLSWISGFIGLLILLIVELILKS